MPPRVPFYGRWPVALIKKISRNVCCGICNKRQRRPGAQVSEIAVSRISDPGSQVRFPIPVCTEFVRVCTGALVCGSNEGDYWNRLPPTAATEFSYLCPPQLVSVGCLGSHIRTKRGQLARRSESGCGSLHMGQQAFRAIVRNVIHSLSANKAFLDG